MNHGYLIEHYIYQYAVRKKYFSLLKGDFHDCYRYLMLHTLLRNVSEFEHSFLQCMPDDLDLWCLTVQRLVKYSDFAHFDLLLDLLDKMQDFVLNKSSLERLIFMVKFLVSGLSANKLLNSLKC